MRRTKRSSSKKPRSGGQSPDRSSRQAKEENDGQQGASLENILDKLSPGNWSPTARRWVPVAAGAAVALIGLRRKSAFGFALAGAGAALTFLGSRESHTDTESIARGSVLLNCTPEEAYSRYRNFEDLPTFMSHLESVTKIGDRQYRWIARGPLEIPVQWDAEVFDEQVGQSISWRSLPDSPVTMQGSVRFASAPANRGTYLSAVTRFDHPASNLARTFAKLLGKDPNFLMQQDLRRFKALIETGEVPTTEGQAHGSRSGLDLAFEGLDPDRPKRREPQTSSKTVNENLNEALKENWRTA
jgi:uncharacterized membrane protein